MNKENVLLPAVISTAFLIAACDPGFLGSDKRRDSDYVTEKLSIKATATTQSSMENRIRELQKKYRISPINVDRGGNQPGARKPEPCASCGKTQSPIALPKAAAEYDIFGVKSASVPIERPYYEAFDVPGGEPITVTVTGTQSSVDPFLVIYEITSGSMYDYTSEQQLSVLAYNDDYSGLNPQATAAASGAYRQVVVLAFSYDAYSKGQANVTIQIGGTTISRSNVWIKGTALFHDNANNEFVYKNGSLVDPLDNGWFAYLPGSTAFVAADYNYWTGDYNWGAYKPSCSGDTYIWAFNLYNGKGMANDDSPGGYCSSLQNDASWTAFPAGWHYPNFVLLGGYGDGGQANFLQISAFQK